MVSMRIRYAVARHLLRIHVWRAAALLCCGFCSQASAQQQSKLMPVLLLAPARSEARSEWADVARGLRQAGLRAMQVADLTIDPVFAACRQPTCAVQAAHAAGMPALLCDVRAGVLSVRWIATDDEVFSERAELDATNQAAAAPVKGALAATTSDLARRILLRRALGERALLRVESRPPGARVTIDGKLAGLTPFEQAWEKGTHRVSVELEGYETGHAEAPLSSGAVHEVRLQLRASRSSLTSMRDEAPRLVPSAANDVLGSLLAVASVPLLIAGANGFIDKDQCLESIAGRCTHIAQAGALEAVMLGAGALSLLGAVYFFVAQPFELWVAATPRAAALSLQGRF
jgi:hypothetical protein